MKSLHKVQQKIVPIIEKLRKLVKLDCDSEKKKKKRLKYTLVDILKIKLNVAS